MHVLIALNAHDAPAGEIDGLIAARGWRATTIFPHAGGDPLPATPEGYDGLVVLGGAQDAWDDAGFPAFADELRLMRAFDAAGKPVLGICLGAQLMARAWGAEVRRMGGFERGLTPMRTRADDAVAGAAGPSPTLVSWHRDTFDLPAGAELLLSSADCANQGFRIGRASWAFQCHVEATPAILRRWIEKSPDLAERTPADYARLADDCGPRFATTTAAGTAIVEAWLDRVASR